MRYLLVTMRILTVRPRDPLVGGGAKFFYQEISLGHHEISPGYQENLLVNKFPVLTPPPNFCSRRSRGELIFNISSGVRLLVPIETPNLLM